MTGCWQPKNLDNRILSILSFLYIAIF